MRKTKDIILNTITYLCSSFGVIILLLILVFVFSNGLKTLNFKMLTNDYYEKTYMVNMKDGENFKLGNFEDPNIENVYFSTSWGVGFSEKKDNGTIVYVSYVSDNSPLKNMKLVNQNEYLTIKLNQKINKVSLTNEANDYIACYSKSGAQEMALAFERGTIINNMVINSGGGGIRGSILTTIYLILLTLVIALPLGIGGAIYLNEYAKDNKFTKILRQMIDLTSGIPSIIFGLVGAILFIPMMDKIIGSNGGSIASGALTMSIILLPVIIKTTEESLKAIPDSYRHASLALGASKTQTVFKVVLPNGINGILTATILSISRIIGESAALIYAIGSTIKDKISINERSSTLSVHIWNIMGGESPNYDLACAIAIIILITVFVLNVLVKIISKKFNKFEVKS